MTGARGWPKAKFGKSLLRWSGPKDVEVAEMTVDAIIFKLNLEEVLRLKRILIDNDTEEALLFLRQSLKPQLDQAGRGRMVREFENT